MFLSGLNINSKGLAKGKVGFEYQEMFTIK